MSSKFSGAVKLGVLNDYIAPSQACVVTKPGLKNDLNGGVQIQLKKTGRIERVVEESNNLPVRVSLHDCLACSGCITSAETVMLEHQSAGEFFSNLNSGRKTVVVSLSPQSRASLAAHYGITPLQAFKKLTGFLKSIGVKAVFDTSFSRDVSLIEGCEEFLARYKSSSDGKSRFCLPILTSACPGWVCYAEKTHGSDILPYISTVKSPQQIMGAVIKRHAAHNLGIRTETIYHVTVMPCYDKKLEASRDDFLFAIEDKNGEIGSRPLIAEVDSVLTSGELLDILESHHVDFASLEEVPLDKMLTNLDESDHLYGVRGGSGGYVEIVFRYAAKMLFGKEFGADLEYKTVRNSDFREVSLKDVDGQIVLRFACAYGFRNIQNLVRKIKAGKCEYDFVEIMACPSGCLNGGGQIKPKNGQSAKDLIQALESVYLAEVDVRDPFSNPVALGLYDEWLEHPRSTKAVDILHTRYHNREKNLVAQIADW